MSIAAQKTRIIATLLHFSLICAMGQANVAQAFPFALIQQGLLPRPMSSVVAGDNTTPADSYGSGVAATSTRIANATAVALDSAGNIYFSDSVTDVVRKINASTGLITTVAGIINTPGYTGNGGAATSAKIVTPMGIAIDSSDNVYVAEQSNHVVRKITASTGNISLVAGNHSSSTSGDGGQATSAAIRCPFAVAVDGSGNLYITDICSHVVRKVTASTGIISRIAGVIGSRGYSGDGGAATSAKLDTPSDVKVDGSGNIYIADTGNSVIRKVTASTGVISTIVGQGDYAYSGDGGLATDANLNQAAGLGLDASGNIYIADSNNNVIRKVSAATGYISTIAGIGTDPGGYAGDGSVATSAVLNYPLGSVGVDSSGNVYFADQSNEVIRKITVSSGNIATISGIATVDGFVGDGDGGLATSGWINSPTSIALDNANNIYIADTGNLVVRKVNASTGMISTIAGNGIPYFSGDGGAATSASLWGPAGVAVDSSGNVYIADSISCNIRKVDASTGNIATVAGTLLSCATSGDGGLATAASFTPSAIALDASNNIYIADYVYSVVRKITISTGIISTVAGSGTCGTGGDGGPATSAFLCGPMGMYIDGSGNIYIADSGNATIRKVTYATGIITTVAGNGVSNLSGNGGLATDASLGNPRSVTFDAAGNMYIAEMGNRIVRKVAAGTNIISTYAGNSNYNWIPKTLPATGASFYGPNSVAVASDGSLYICDQFFGAVYKVK